MIHNRLMYRLLTIFLLLLIILSISSCKDQSANNTQSTGNPFLESVGNNEEVMFAYGFGLESPKYEKKIVYTGEPIEIEYYINNNGTTMSTGMLMFVNGIPQSYSIAGSSTSTYMHIQEVEENKRAIVRISFVPVCGKAGETVNVRFLSILNPQIRPDQLNYLFGHTNRMTTFMARTIEMQMDADAHNTKFPVLDKQRDMTQEEIDQVIYVDSKGNSVDKLGWFHFVARNTKDPSSPYLNIRDHKIEYTLQGYGGPAAEYIIIPYINQIPVLNEAYPCLMSIEAGTKVYSQNMTLSLATIDKTAYKIEQFNTIYFLAIPLSGSINLEPMITNSYVFTGDAE